MRIRNVPRELEGVRAQEAMHAASNDWGALPKWLRDCYEEGCVLFLRDAVALQGAQRIDVAPEDWITWDGSRLGQAPAADFEAIEPGPDEEWGQSAANRTMEST